MEVVMSYLQEYVFQKKTKDISVKVLKMITNKNEAKEISKHISCDGKSKFIVQHAIQIKNWVMKHVTVNVKIIVSTKKIIVGILPYTFVRTASI